MQRRVGIEDRLQHLGGDLAVDADAGRGVVLQPDLALECDQRARPLRAQALGGADRLRDGLAVEAGVVFPPPAAPSSPPRPPVPPPPPPPRAPTHIPLYLFST